MDLAQRGPIGLFDYQLKHLSDSYLLFFQERLAALPRSIPALLTTFYFVRAKIEEA